jgi:hypothetical protein
LLSRVRRPRGREGGDGPERRPARAPESAGEAQSNVPTVLHLLREFRRAVLANAEDVGGRFPEEARKIHYGETKVRGISGTASGEEAQALIEEGIEIMMLPPLPEEAN